MRLPALVMAGGRGERFKGGEKPLAMCMGRPLVEHILMSLEKAKKISAIHVVTSPWTRRTEEHLAGRWGLLRAPGKSYVKDMVYALKTLGLGPTLIAAADLPLIKPGDVDSLVSVYLNQREPALAVMVPLSLFRSLGLTPTSVYEDLVPAGINVVDGKNLEGPQKILVVDNPRFAVNVNTKEDLLRLNRKAFK